MKDNITNHILDYLQVAVTGFKIDTKRKPAMFTCPSCRNTTISAYLIPGQSKIRCSSCNSLIHSIYDIVRIVEPDKCAWDDEEVFKHVRTLLKLPLQTEDELDNILKFYEENGFDLVPVARGQKIPIEKDWVNKNHKYVDEWKEWLSNNLNLGVKTGKTSGITVIDIDQAEIPQELNNVLAVSLYQKTARGHQIFFKYTPDLPTTRVDELKIDILNDGKQAVIYPSVVDGHSRTIEIHPIIEMPIELKKFFQQRVSVPVKSFSEKLKDDIKTDNLIDLNIKPVEEGNRTNFLMHFGGILRKEMNISQTSYTLNLINRHLCKPPISIQELDNVVGSLDKYCVFDEQELALKVLQYMKIVEESGSRDIREALGENTTEGKQRIEKAIKYLVKEGFLIKKRRLYQVIKKGDWKDSFFEESKTVNYKMPYFHDFATFRNSDLVIIGGGPKIGKTHICLNIIKRLVAQGKKPYYISLESGNRFSIIAEQLGLKDGDFNWCVHFNPETIELEPDAITIVDWILPTDYAETDKLFKHFAEQLVKHGGNMIAFVQLKDNNEFFAKNMIPFFPSLVSRYIYDNPEDGATGYFQLDYIREPKIRSKTAKVMCAYDWDAKELKRVDEFEAKPQKAAVSTIQTREELLLGGENV